MIASAMIERAELPVQRKSTLYGRSVIAASQNYDTSIIIDILNHVKGDRLPW
jgi:hypothetical protein